MADANTSEVVMWIREYGPALLPVARAFADGPIEAEDILQEAWIVALRKRKGRPIGVPVRAWLHRIVMNVGRSAARKRTRRMRLLGSNLPNRSPTPRPPTIQSDLMRRAMWRRVASLPKLQRDVLVLRIVEGMSTREAAERLGRAEGTVKASLSRGLSSLRTELSDALDASA